MYGQPAPVYGQPVPAGNSAVKVILIVVGVLLALGLLAVALITFSVWRVSRAVHHTANGVSISTPNGTVTMGGNSSISEADLGVPVYPGATRAAGGMQIRSGKNQVVTAIYSTTDPSEKVVDFYKNKLPADSSVTVNGNRAVITAGDKDKESWLITANPDSSDSGKTQITIMHVKKS